MHGERAQACLQAENGVHTNDPPRPLKALNPTQQAARGSKAPRTGGAPEIARGRSAKPGAAAREPNAARSTRAKATGGAAAGARPKP